MRRTVSAWMAGCALVACSAPPRAAPRAPDPCAIARADASGPRAEAVSSAAGPLEVARLREEEATLTGDDGFRVLALQALACAESAGPLSVEGRRLRGTLLLASHDFAGAEALADALVAEEGSWRDHLLRSDARMEQGDLDGASRALDAAFAARPSALLWDRSAWLAWLQGDLDTAIDHELRAVRMGSRADPVALSWSLAHLGWFHALAGTPSDALDAARQLDPTNRWAALHRGLVRLHTGHPGAEADLREAGDTLAARLALRELHPDLPLEDVGLHDPRAYAIARAPTDPVAARRLLLPDRASRRDAMTRMAWAWVRHHAGEDAVADARAALASGTRDPQVLWMAAQILGDPHLARAADAQGPGLRPSQRRALRPLLEAESGSPHPEIPP